MCGRMSDDGRRRSRRRPGGRATPAPPRRAERQDRVGAQPRRAGPRLPQHRDRRRRRPAVRDDRRPRVGERPGRLLRVRSGRPSSSIRLGDSGIAMDLREWVNQGLMTLFFLVVGLEAKRELDLGQLRERSRIAIPVVAALGGMVLPIAIFLAFNAGGAGREGLGRGDVDRHRVRARRPRARRARTGRASACRCSRSRSSTTSSRSSSSRSPTPSTSSSARCSIGGRAVRGPGRRAAADPAPACSCADGGAASRPAIWVALHASGIDPLISGLAVGLLVSAYQPVREDLEQVVERVRSFREQPTPELARSAQRGVASRDLAERAHPVRAAPVDELRDRAAVRAGQHRRADRRRPAVAGASRRRSRSGIFFGYVVGKPLGITVATWLATALRGVHAVGELAGHVRRAASSAGSGFTVSLLISSIAFDGDRLAEAKIGVLAAAVAAAVARVGRRAA